MGKNLGLLLLSKSQIGKCQYVDTPCIISFEICVWISAFWLPLMLLVRTFRFLVENALLVAVTLQFIVFGEDILQESRLVHFSCAVFRSKETRQFSVRVVV